MEVHQHGHIHLQKKWKEYLFQFFMLFLAVFCGFVAEYKLEHFIEHNRSKELAKSLYLEFYTDSIAAQKNLETRLMKEESLDYIQNYFKDNKLADFPKQFYPHLTWSFILSNPIRFEPKDGMLNQLKNSGALRYFRSAELQKLMGEISVVINNIWIRNEQEYTYVAQYIRPFLLKHFDYHWLSIVSEKGSIPYQDALSKYSKENSILHSELQDSNKLNRKEASNLASYYLLILRSTRVNQLTAYINTNRLILESLCKNYNVKD